ncbi:VOC family protein [Kribbella sp. NPDC051770]|uniref:VOC family protein n=1 Tax=Kribbella sp. NPDC051770 TaxID=3155413 RepID=UPI0034464768
MSLARFKDLCVDVTEVGPMVDFWGTVLGLTAPADAAADGPVPLRGDQPAQTVWINKVPEPRSVKQRVHLDVHASGIAGLEKLGATVQSPIDHEQSWAVMEDPEGGEFCGFPRDSVPAYRLMEVVVDSADPERQARWWHQVLGGDLQLGEGKPYSWLENVPGLPFDYFVFISVPEPKTVKNRVHWDVDADALEPLLAAGATLLRPQDSDIQWNICADPEGNEFCVFLPTPKD